MDKYNTLLQENKRLKKEVDSKFSAERFNIEQELEDSKRDYSLIEAKNKQLEQRIALLDGRLGDTQDSE